MWFLKGPKGELIYLRRNSTINVGRIQGDIVLRDDKSISRSHASVSVESKNEEKKSLCFVKDTGSKYGSTILRAGEAIKITKEGIKIENNDIIKFGLQNNDYVASYIPTVVLLSSMNDIRHLQSIIKELDGYIVQEWSSEVSHLTTVNAKLGEKTAMALVNCIPIIGIEYWEAAQIAVKNNQDWPKFSDYILPISEDIIDQTKVSLSPNINRKTLFENLTFLFFSYSQFNIYKKIIKGSGGKSLMFNKSVHTDLMQFCSDKFIVVYYMIGSDQTEESILDSQKMKTAYEEIEELLRKSKRRMISDSEIMLAILHCSIEQNCNSKYNYKELLLKKKENASKEKRKANVFALDTEELHSKSLVSQNKNNIVPETNEFVSQEFDDTDWSVIGDRRNITNSSFGISAISTIRGDTQESTEDIGTEMSKLNMNQKRSEKRSSELVSSTPAKKTKLNSGSSLFPVLSKKSTQNSQNSQTSLISQSLKNSQLMNRSNDSIIADSVPKTTSRSQNKFTQPSTSNETGKQTKAGATKNIFGSWMDEPRTSKIQIIEECDSSKKRIESNKDTNNKEGNNAQKVITRLDDSSSSSSSIGSKSKRNELRNLRNTAEIICDSDDELIAVEEPKTKKRRVNTEISSSSSKSVTVERNDKRKRDSGNESDSNQFVMQKKQNRVVDENQCRRESNEIDDNDNDYVKIRGLIRQQLNDSPLNDTFGHKIFQKVFVTIPRTRILRDSMVDYGIEVE